MAKNRDNERSLKEAKERTAGLAQSAREALEAVEVLKGELREEDGRLTAARAVGVSTGFRERLALRAQERTVKDLREKLTAAEAALSEKEEALGVAEDELAALQAEVFEPRARAAIEADRRLAAEFGKLQAALLEVFRKRVALHVAYAAKVPRQVVYRRSSRFVKVEPLEMRDAYKRRDGSIETFTVELLKAIEREREGVWKILPGQDLDPGPEIEVVTRDGPLPEELEVIRKLDIGMIFAPNGKPPKVGSLRDGWERVDFYAMKRKLGEKEIAAATKILEEGA